jgi:plastocyanin
MKRLTFLVVSALVLAGCGGDKAEVGDKSLLNFEEQANQRLGATTTTAAPSTTTSVTGPGGKPYGQGGTAGTTPTTKATVKTAPPTTAATVPEATLEIAIRSDNAESKFDPESAAVYLGSIVRWVNKDTVARSVEADGGQFKSPPIPPGGKFEYRATREGAFNYHDGTRPYAVAILQVLPK